MCKEGPSIRRTWNLFRGSWGQGKSLNLVCPDWPADLPRDPQKNISSQLQSYAQIQQGEGSNLDTINRLNGTS